MNKLRNILAPKPLPKEGEGDTYQPRPVHALPAPTPAFSANPPRLILIGGGSRGSSLARAIVHGSNGRLVAIAEPDAFKRRQVGRQYIWGVEEAKDGEEFESWEEFLEWELARRAKDDALSTDAIDAAVICTPDRTHRDIVKALAPLRLHVMCEKPLATSLEDVLDIYRYLGLDRARPGVLFAVGHVMRYSPHNQLLRKLVCEDRVVGEVVSVEHTENVGWWHFSHSYVRGNWRNESTSGPTLLTKSCHDIDFLLWLLCEPNIPQPGQQRETPHLPSSVSSSGSLTFFRQPRKPRAAKKATNCLSCPIEKECHFSARKIYWEQGICQGLGGWPVNVVVPDIEDYLDEGGLKGAATGLDRKLAEDYTEDTPADEVSSRQWYGRCVFESDNDVCDDQTVHITWDDDEASGRMAKRANFHMTAFTQGVCTKQTKIFGTRGEIETNGKLITVHDFVAGETREIRPPLAAGGHSGGDFGLMKQFILAVDALKNGQMDLERAQVEHIGCTAQDIVRSHAMVFAAEEARKSRASIDWARWWDEHCL